MVVFELLIILLLILINGFFVGAEFAIVSLRPSRIEEMIKENKPYAAVTLEVSKQLNDMLSVCQVGITIASLLLGWLGEKYVATVIEKTLSFLSIAVNGDLNIHGISVMVAFGVITFLHITVGELIPKSVAIVNYEVVALYSAYPLRFFYYLFYPVTYLLNRVTNYFLTTFDIPDSSHKFVHTAEELMIILKEQETNGTIDEEELRLIQNTFSFSDTEAKSVMTHRLKIVAIEENTKIRDVPQVIISERFSRYPVYQNTKDKIIGVVHVQAVIDWLHNPANEHKNETVRSIMQRPVKVPDTLSIEKVMKKLRKNKQHMAVVVDEYGGVSGLLTLEDIIEEIFGQIKDETDEEDLYTHDVSTGVRTIPGETELDSEILLDVLEGEEFQDEALEFRTIAGFFNKKFQDIPQEGSSVNVKNGILSILKMKDDTILLIKFDSKPMEVVPTKEDYD